MRIARIEMIKEIQAEARKVGLIFKFYKALTINKAPAYKFINIKTGGTAMANCTLFSAYENSVSGYIATWNGEEFEGLGQY